MSSDISNNSARRAAMIRRIVEEAMERRARGEQSPDRELTAAHPELMPELAEELRLLRVLERARAESSSTRASAMNLGSVDVGLHGSQPNFGEAERSGLPHFPGYRTVRAVDRGGQGLVFEAIQDRTELRVAIKLMRDSALGLGPSDAGRFLREVRVLGRLDHPHIVRILGSGIDRGHAYFVMEYIDGSAMDVHLAARKWSISERVILIEKIGNAVDAAHVCGVIHRDLKPANVLIDQNHDPHVLDFGLARLTEDFEQANSPTPDRGMTLTGQFIGSIPWASPEQARGDSALMDGRTDVYALGLLLFYALTGQAPYKTDGGIEETLRNIGHAVPARAALLANEIEPDLETIVLKCLSKEPTQRYQRARDFVSDLRAYLEGRPIAARPPSVARQLRWFVRRNRTVVIGLAGIFAAMVVGLTTTIWQLQRAVHSETVAATQRDHAEMRAYVSGLALAVGTLENTEHPSGACKALADTPEHLRGWEWRHLMARANQSVASLSPGRAVRRVAVSGNSARMLLMFEDGGMEARNALTDAVLWTGQAAMPECDAVFSRNGKYLALQSRQREISLRDADSGKELRHWKFDHERMHPACVAPGDYGELFVVFYKFERDRPDTPQVRRYNPGQDEPAFAVNTVAGRGAPFGLAVSPDGAMLYVSWSESLVSAHDARTGIELRSWTVPTLCEGTWTNIAVSADGRLGAVSISRDIHLYELPEGRFLRTLRGHTKTVSGLAFDPAGGRLVSGSMDESIRIWDLESQGPERVLLGHGSGIGAWTTRDAHHLISYGVTDGSCLSWSLDQPGAMQAIELNEGRRGVYSQPVVFDPDSRGLTAFSEQTTVRVELPSRQVKFEHHDWMSTHGGTPILDPVRGTVYWMAATPSGEQSLGAWNTMTWEQIWSDSTSTPLCSPVAISPDGTHLYTDHGTHAFAIRDARTGKVEHVLDCSPGRALHAAFLEKSRTIITSTAEGVLAVWDASTYRKLHEFTWPHGPTADFVRFAVNPGETTIAGAWGETGQILLWDIATRTFVREFAPSGSLITVLAFSPDGQRLATGDEQNAVRIWHVQSGIELLRLNGHTHEITALAWSPDGEYLASVGRDERLILWDSVTCAERAKRAATPGK